MTFGYPGPFAANVFGDPQIKTEFESPDTERLAGTAINLITARFRARNLDFNEVPEPQVFGVPGPFAFPNFNETDIQRRVETFLFSSAAWVARPNEDLRPNQAAIPRAINSINVTRQATINPGRVSRSSTTDGYFELNNSDGALDFLFATAEPNGLAVDIIRGMRQLPTSLWEPRLIARARNLQATGSNLRIELQSDRSPFTTALNPSSFSGAGGLAGDSDLAGQQKYTAIGNCQNVSPLLIDRANNIWHYDSGPAGGAYAAYDGAVPLTFAGTVDTYEQLVASTPLPGTYIDCPNFGCMKPWSVPATLLTLDILGRKVGSRQLETMADAVNLATDVAGLSSSELNSAAINTLPSGTISYFDRGTATALALLDELTASLPGFHGFNRFNQFGLYRWVTPEDLTTAPTLRVRGHTIQSEVPSLFVRTEQTVVYGRNHTPMTDSQILAGATDERRAFVSSTGNRYTLANGNASIFDGARPGDDIISVWVDQEESVRLASTTIGLVGQPRVLISAQAGLDSLGVELGDVIQLETDRLGVESVRAIVTAISDQSDARENTIQVFLTPSEIDVPYRWQPPAQAEEFFS